MPQLVSYPLPPLFLTEIIDKCREDHTHRCDARCAEDEYMCWDWSIPYSSDMTPVVVKIDPGYGRHKCDATCRPNDTHEGRCMRSCDDSDWIVELQYHTKGYHAVYGVKKHGDVQDIQLWMD